MVKNEVRRMNLKCLFILLVLFSMAKFTNAAKPFVIKGQIKNGSKQLLYVENMFAQQFHLLDTVRLDSDGKFYIEGNVDEDAIIRLRLSKTHFWWVILEKKEYTVELNLNRFRKDKQEVKGSASTKTLYGFLKAQRTHLQKMQVAKQKLFTVKQQGNQALMSNEEKNAFFEKTQRMKDRVNMLSESYFDFLKSYVDTSQSLTAIIAGESIPAEQFPTYLRKAIKSLKKRFKGSKYVMQFENVIEHKLKLLVGAEAPEIALNSPDQKIIKLSSLKGKYVLIDFWASWCRPCRAANPHIVKLYEKYKKKGFAIFSVSLDQRKASWVKAIEADGLVWDTHVSDLKGWQSAAAKEYEIRGIPTTYLLDKKGRIIARDLRGESLDRKLKEVFEK